MIHQAKTQKQPYEFVLPHSVACHRNRVMDLRQKRTESMRGSRCKRQLEHRDRWSTCHSADGQGSSPAKKVAKKHVSRPKTARISAVPVSIHRRRGSVVAVRDDFRQSRLRNPVVIPRLVRGDGPAPRGCRSLPGARRQEQGRGGPREIWPVQSASGTYVGLDRVCLRCCLDEWTLYQS